VSWIEKCIYASTRSSLEGIIWKLICCVIWIYLCLKKLRVNQVIYTIITVLQSME
jgi:hypothetical protein